MKREKQQDWEMLVIALDSQVRYRILLELRDNPSGLNITELKKRIELIFKRSYNFKTITFHVNTLERARLITREKQQRKKGRPLIIKLKALNLSPKWT